VFRIRVRVRVRVIRRKKNTVVALLDGVFGSRNEPLQTTAASLVLLWRIGFVQETPSLQGHLLDWAELAEAQQLRRVSLLGSRDLILEMRHPSPRVSGVRGGVRHSPELPHFSSTLHVGPWVTAIAEAT